MEESEKIDPPRLLPVASMPFVDLTPGHRQTGGIDVDSVGTKGDTIGSLSLGEM